MGVTEGRVGCKRGKDCGTVERSEYLGVYVSICGDL